VALLDGGQTLPSSVEEEGHLTPGSVPGEQLGELARPVHDNRARGRHVNAPRVAALQDVPVGILTALALRELAGSLPRIEHLTVTPDLLTDLVGRLGAREGR
jgi:hypothetical protein